MIQSEIKWENNTRNLCVMCSELVKSNSFWTCKKCSKVSDIIHKHVEGDLYDIKSVCCNHDVINNQSITCSVLCHENFVKTMIKENGEFKKVTDMHTEIIHKVPIRDIIEYGLNYDNLGKYPLWSDE